MLKRSLLWLRAHRHTFIVSAVAILFVILLGSLGTLSNSFQQCDAGRSAVYSQKEQPTFREKTGTIVVCEGVTIDANGGLLTALATIAVAAFTLTLWLSAVEQAKLTRQAINLAQDEFLATHRPRVVFQNVVQSDFGSAVDAASTVDISFVNAGESTAVVLSWRAILYIQTADTAFWPDLNAITSQSHDTFKLKPGEAITVRATQKNLYWERGDLLAGEGKLFLVGEVEYTSRSGIMRTTGFARNFAEGHWKPVKDSAYEYTY